MPTMLPMMLGISASVTSFSPPSPPPIEGRFSGQFFSGVSLDAEGAQFLLLLDQARRMFATADPELMTLTGNYDPVALGITEGAQWKGNFWTQNSYGVGYASLPILPQPALHWISNSFRWWFDHMGDSTQTYGGLADAPDGMLCDNGHPTGCNYMQCGFGRRRSLLHQRNDTTSNANGLEARSAGEAAGPQPRHPSKRTDTIREWEATQDFALHASETVPTLKQLKQRHRRLDTAGVGKDFAIGGTLAGGVMQAEYVLATRNVTAAKEFLPKFLRMSNFMEGRRAQNNNIADSGPIQGMVQGLFRAGNGANLLAPAYGGWPLPVGCVANGSFNNCTNRAMAYLTELTVTYSALLDRLIELEALAYPDPTSHNCSGHSLPNTDAPWVAGGCAGLYRFRRETNDRSMQALLQVMNNTASNPPPFISGNDAEDDEHDDASIAHFGSSGNNVVIPGFVFHPGFIGDQSGLITHGTTRCSDIDPNATRDGCIGIATALCLEHPQCHSFSISAGTPPGTAYELFKNYGTENHLVNNSYWATYAQPLPAPPANGTKKQLPAFRGQADLSLYLVRSIDPNGERHGVYSPRAPCQFDEPCGVTAPHGFFESAPNHDAIALRVVDDDLSQSMYASMTSIEGLRPCGWTIPNFPDYDDSCNGCMGWGTWVSGGSWSTAEGRAILAHFRGGRLDLAAASMGRLIDPYARLFKLDNPIAHMGCGPGMYSADTLGLYKLDVDVFGIPSAFLHGLLGYRYTNDSLVLEPSLPPGVTALTQEFPARFGNLSLFFTLSGQSPPAPAPAPPAPPPPPSAPPPPPFNCSVFNCSCTDICDYYGMVNGAGFGCAPVEAQHFWAEHGCHCAAKKGLCSGVACKLPTNVCPCPEPGIPPPPSPCTAYANGTLEPEDPRQFLPKAEYPWFQIPTRVDINGKVCSECLSKLKPRVVQLRGDLLQASGTGVAVHIYFGVLNHSTNYYSHAAEGGAKIVHDGGAALSRWEARQAARSVVSMQGVPANCRLSAMAQANVTNSSLFSDAMSASGLSQRFEAAQAAAFREAINVSVTRCMGRLDGSIPPIPAEPKEWINFTHGNMKYNQSSAESFFSDLPARIWTGLVNNIASYENPSSGSLHGPVEMQVSALFRGKSVAAASAIAREVEQREAQTEVARLKKQLEEAEGKLGQM